MDYRITLVDRDGKSSTKTFRSLKKAETAWDDVLKSGGIIRYAIWIRIYDNLVMAIWHPG